LRSTFCHQSWQSAACPRELEILGLPGALIYVYYFHFPEAPPEEMAVNYFFLIMSFWPKIPLNFLSTDFCFFATSKRQNKRKTKQTRNHYYNDDLAGIRCCFWPKVMANLLQASNACL